MPAVVIGVEHQGLRQRRDGLGVSVQLASHGAERAPDAGHNTEDQDGGGQEQDEVAENKQYGQQHRCSDAAQSEVIVQCLATETVDESAPAPPEKPHAKYGHETERNRHWWNMA